MEGFGKASQRSVNRESTAVTILIPFLIRKEYRRLQKEVVSMKSKIVRALIAALVAGTLLLAGTAPYGRPGLSSTISIVHN